MITIRLDSESVIERIMKQFSISIVSYIPVSRRNDSIKYLCVTFQKVGTLTYGMTLRILKIGVKFEEGTHCRR